MRNSRFNLIAAFATKTSELNVTNTLVFGQNTRGNGRNKYISSLNFDLLVWIQRAEQRVRIISDINFAIFEAFTEAKIQIPFPQRDVHIRNAPEPESEPEKEKP